MVVTLDGMDQSKTNIPDHDTSESNVTDFTKEANNNVEVLRRILDDQAKLPPTLVPQLDNTSQENKNSRLFTFLAELVEAGVFPSPFLVSRSCGCAL